jgi:hypothetical protein
MSKRAVSHAYLIHVNADVSGNFTYTVNGNPSDGRIQPNIGDTISWQATWMNLPTAFQIQFTTLGPFGGASRVQRSLFGPTSPATVALPPNYRGNLIFEYTVTLANGWSDDPDVEPVPHDGIAQDMNVQCVLLSLINGELVLTPSAADFSKGVVNWRWDPGQNFKDAFTLTFTTPPLVPKGWPQGAQSQSGEIALNLPASNGVVNYTIDTATLGVSGGGSITVK